MHRFAMMRAYMGPEWLKVLEWFDSLKRGIEESIADDAVFQNIREQVAPPILSGVTLEATRAR